MDALERLAAAARPAPEDGVCQLLYPLGTDLGRCVLTRVEPLDAGPIGRPGNYWAESLVVPEAWLVDSGWNVSAAFYALRWWGSDVAHHVGRWPHWLQAEALPLLPPADPREAGRWLQRLDGELRWALLESLWWQGEGGGREDPTPIYLVEAPGAAPEELSALVLSLPSLLPEEVRMRGHGPERRCLRLGTRGSPTALPAMDLLGVPDRELEEVRGRGGVLIDLGGRISPSRPGGREAQAWARSLDAALASGDGAELGRLLAPGSPRRHGRESRPPDGQPTRGDKTMSRDEEDRELEDPVAARKALWQAREEAEGEAGALLDLFQEELQQMFGAVEGKIRGEMEDFEGELARLAGALREAAEEEKRRLDEASVRALEDIRSEGKEGSDEIDRVYNERMRRLRTLKEDLLRLLADDRQQALDTLNTAYKKAASDLGRASHDQLAGQVSSQEPQREKWPGLQPPPPVIQQPSQQTGREATDPALEHGEGEPGGETGMEQPKPGWKERIRELLRRLWESPWKALAAFGVLFLIVFGIAYLARTHQKAPETTRSTHEASTTTAATQLATLRSDVRHRLQEGVLAARLLGAAAQTKSRVRDDAAGMFLDLTRGPQPLLDADASCALLQSAINAWHQERGENEPISVDGNCGDKSKKALKTVVQGTGCVQGDWTQQAACFLKLRIEASSPRTDCSATWPFNRDCDWQPPEAERMLAMLRSAHAAKSALHLDRYDLTATPGLAASLAGKQITPEDARRLAELAWVASRARLGATEPVRALDQMTEEQLRAVDKYLDDLPNPEAEGEGG